MYARSSRNGKKTSAHFIAYIEHDFQYHLKIISSNLTTNWLLTFLSTVYVVWLHTNPHITLHDESYIFYIHIHLIKSLLLLLLDFFVTPFQNLIPWPV